MPYAEELLLPGVATGRRRCDVRANHDDDTDGDEGHDTAQRALLRTGWYQQPHWIGLNRSTWLIAPSSLSSVGEDDRPVARSPCQSHGHRFVAGSVLYFVVWYVLHACMHGQSWESCSKPTKLYWQPITHNSPPGSSGLFPDAVLKYCTFEKQ